MVAKLEVGWDVVLRFLFARLDVAHSAEAEIANAVTGAIVSGLEVVLLRMVQESLTNVRRHAEATAVTISLRVNENHATLRVSDNGSGFDQAMPADGFGLRGMRNRAAQVGGTLSVHSGENGTTVELEVPR